LGRELAEVIGCDSREEGDVVFGVEFGEFALRGGVRVVAFHFFVEAVG